MANGASTSRPRTPRSRRATISIPTSTVPGGRARTFPPTRPRPAASTTSYNLTLEQKKYVIASQAPDTQIGGLYKSFMDEKAVEKVGDKPLRAELAKLATISDKSALARYMGATAGGFGRSIVDLGVDADTADPTTNVLWLSQAGLGLPDRDYYLKADFKPQSDAYLAYLKRQLTLAGYPDPAKAATRHHGLRNRDREDQLAGRRPPRDREDQQSDDARPAQGLCAGFRLGRLSRRRRDRRAGQDDRAGEQRDQGDRGSLREDAARDAQGLGSVRRDRPGLALSAQALCRQPLPVHQRDQWRETADAALEAGRHAARRLAGRADGARSSSPISSPRARRR